TGAIKWQTFMIPPRPAGHIGNWYAGASIWGSTGAIDRTTNQIFMATGNNVSAPESVAQCLKDGIQPPNQCGIDPGDHFDSVVALDLDTGKINWSARGLPNDIYNVACGLVIPGVLPYPSPVSLREPMTTAPILPPARQRTETRIWTSRRAR